MLANFIPILIWWLCDAKRNSSGNALSLNLKWNSAHAIYKRSQCVCLLYLELFELKSARYDRINHQKWAFSLILINMHLFISVMHFESGNILGEAKKTETDIKLNELHVMTWGLDISQKKA